MKTAICLSGLLGGKAGRDGIGQVIDPSVGGKTIKSSFIDRYDSDVFIHSWNTNEEGKILEYYNPKDYIIEPRKDFSHLTIQDYGLKNFQELINHPSNKLTYRIYKNQKGMSDEEYLNFYLQLIQRVNSRWLSTQKVVNLMRKYETENNIKYDFVLLSRFDMMFNKPFIIEGLNKNIVYLSERRGREDKNNAYHDLFLLSCSDNIYNIGQIYDDIFNFSISPIWAIKEQIDKLGLKTNHIMSLDKDYQIVRNRM